MMFPMWNLKNRKLIGTENRLVTAIGKGWVGKMGKDSKLSNF